MRKGSCHSPQLAWRPSLSFPLAVAVLLLESSKLVSASEAGLCYHELGDHSHSLCHPPNFLLYC